MFSHSSLQVAALGEQQRLQRLPNGVDVRHHDHPQDGGKGDQEADHQAVQPSVLLQHLLLVGVHGDIGRRNRGVGEGGHGVRGAVQTLGLHDDQNQFGQQKYVAEEVEGGVWDAAEFPQPCRTRRLDWSRTECSVKPGCKSSISCLERVVEGANYLHNRVLGPGRR